MNFISRVNKSIFSPKTKKKVFFFQREKRPNVNFYNIVCTGWEPKFVYYTGLKIRSYMTTCVWSVSFSIQLLLYLLPINV